MNRMNANKPRQLRGVQRDRIFVIGGIVCGLIIIWIAFELGQIRAGHNGLEALQRYGEFEAQLDAAGKQNNELHSKIALLETGRKIDEEAYSQVGQQLVELQNKILAQQEDLAFYRGIVADQQTGLRVQDLELLASSEPESFSLRLVLAQALRASQRISGSAKLQVEGVSDGKPLTLGLAELGVDAAQRKSLTNFSFRYFLSLEADLVLPEGFVPERVIVTLTPKGKRTKAVEKTFDWTVRAG